MPAHISEVSYSGNTNQDFIEIAVETGTDLSAYSVAIYDEGGTVITTLSFGTAVTTVAGMDVYLLDSGTTGFVDIGAKDAVALVDDVGSVLQFVSFKVTNVTATEGPADTQTSTIIGTAGLNESLQSDDGGSTYYKQTSPNEGTIPCYAPGTLIATPDVPRAVESLAPGDPVETLDHGPLPVLWVQRREVDLRDALPDKRPVLIAAGALGPGRPAADLVVSPQHRILVGGCGQLDGLGQGQAFAPAKALTGLPGIRHMMGRQSAVWVHFALAGHEVVTAGGCLSESLLLGRMALAGMSPRQRCELRRLFPAPVEDALNGPPARDCLTVGQVRRALAQWPARKDARQHAA